MYDFHLIVMDPIGINFLLNDHDRTSVLVIVRLSNLDACFFSGNFSYRSRENCLARDSKPTQVKAYRPIPVGRLREMVGRGKQ